MAIGPICSPSMGWLSKQMRKAFSYIVVVILWATACDAATIYMGSGEAYTTLQSAVAAMNGSDTLIIRGGTYSGSSNYINESHMPPSGSSGNPTIIQAENDGGAIFPDSFLRMAGATARQYIDFIGLTSHYKVELLGCNHVRFFRCGVDHNPTSSNYDATWGIGEFNTYILLEDCWSFGGGRYKFLAYGGYAPSGPYDTHHIIFRRCVARHDWVENTPINPMAAFSMYAVEYVEMQNCIVIDSDQDQFWVGIDERHGFYSHHGSRYIYMRGCIVLNCRYEGFGGGPANDNNIYDFIAWDVARFLNVRNDYGYDAATLRHVTTGHLRSTNPSYQVPMTAQGTVTYNGVSESIEINDSILYDVDGTAVDGSEMLSDYNVLHSNTTDFSGSGGPAGSNDYCMANSNAIDPTSNGLLYLPRIESGSALSGSGSGSTDRGATILKKIGVSGTFYGDSDYNATTTDDLWPWPYENRIHTEMNAYETTANTYPSGSDTISGNRGFAVSGETLTKYIWEYLGNTIPADIYGAGLSHAAGVTLSGVSRK